MLLQRALLGAALLAASLVQGPLARAAELDIKRLAPTDAYTIVHARKNPERAYQAEYLEEAWQTFRDERIAERVWEIIISRAPEEKIDKLKDAWTEMSDALEPINWAALEDSEEFLMASVMVGPFGHTVLAFKLTEEDAKDYRQGVGNLFEVFQKWSDGKVTTETADSADAQMTKLVLPKEVPYQPVAAAVGDLFIICTSPELLERCLGQLKDEDAESKFDDERLVAALKELPEPEDVLTFFDARQMFASMKGLGDFIREQKPDDEDAERGAKVIEKIIDEIAIIDYEVNIEYTEDGKNRTVAYGEWAEGFDDTLLGQALDEGESFEDWKSWVPAGATSYSMGTGINLHVLYAGVLEYVMEEFPESHEELKKWDEVQDKVGVHLDEDILQSFSGEHVSVTLKDGQSVSAFKCSDPDKIKELLARAIEGIKNIPQAAMYGIELADVDDEDLEGFQELKMAMIPASQGRPVIGFRDGWMFIASSPEAVKTLLAVRAGDEDSIEGDEDLEKFDLDTDGEVYAVSYSDVGAGIRAAADGIDQAAMMAPMFMGAATANAPEEVRKAITEAIGLLPSVAKVVRKFDFLEQSLSITRAGDDDEDTYRRDSVMLIRQPEDN
jgi:hypothetical protein